MTTTKAETKELVDVTVKESSTRNIKVSSSFDMEPAYLAERKVKSTVSAAISQVRGDGESPKNEISFAFSVDGRPYSNTPIFFSLEDLDVFMKTFVEVAKEVVAKLSSK